MQFPTLLQGWVSNFCAEGRGWVMCFLSITFPNAPLPPPPRLYFLTSPLTVACFVAQPLNRSKLELTLPCYKSSCFSHVNHHIHGLGSMTITGFAHERLESFFIKQGQLLPRLYSRARGPLLESPGPEIKYSNRNIKNKSAVPGWQTTLFCFIN